MIDVIWDMETGDPDDYFTLLLLLGHPEVNLKAVTVTPGAPDQMGLIKKVLDIFGRKMPIGSFNIDHPKKCVSRWYYNVLGNIESYTKVQQGADVIMENSTEDTTIITGGPLKNLGAAIEKYPNLRVRRLVAQGGFAGEGVIPSGLQLEKFKGMRTCPTYNLNGDPKAGLIVLAFDGIETKRFVSKNVCHGVYYDRELHNRLAPIKLSKAPHLFKIYQGMDYYLMKHPQGKKFHDPLAACAAINEDIINWREVEIFREKGKWGSKLCPGSGIWISIDYDREMFIDTLLTYEE
jgi:pyrimidine-specific ribonucleoside hydrolase